MSSVAIRAEGLSKLYHLGARQRGYRTLRDTLSDAAAKPFRAAKAAFRREKQKSERPELWALRDLSFEVRTGEVIGVIGRNGAGKSTLLKILSRITEPTRGYAEMIGRVGSLLEVGTGFHPELTGRENTYLNGAILGMRRTEIDRKFDEIVSFAEISEFIDTPVKHYSSGMYLRLAFAVAAHLEPEILLVDEVLAVGDAAFQRKCTGKMSDVARQNRTILFVSHNMGAMRQLCTSAMLLSGGKLVDRGDTDEMIRRYLSSTMSTDAVDLSSITDRQGRGDIRVIGMGFEDAAGLPTTGLVAGHAGRIVLKLSNEKPFRRVRAGISFLDTYSQQILYLNSYFVCEDMAEIPPFAELVCHIPRVHLAPGRYHVALRIQSSSTILQDRIADAGYVEVFDGNFFGTGRTPPDGSQVFLMDYQWSAREAQAFAAAQTGTAGQRGGAGCQALR